MEWWHIYLFTRLDAINQVLKFIVIFGAIAGIPLYCMLAFMWGGSETLAEDKEVRTKLKKHIPKILIIYCLVGLLTILLPTQEQAAAIYLIPKLANSQWAKEAEKLPVKATELLNLKFDEWLKSVQQKGEKK